MPKDSILVACRPAKILSDEGPLDLEFRAGRWAYHKLLNFEDICQARIDKVQELCAPGIGIVGRILAKLRGHNRKRERTNKFVPRSRPELERELNARMTVLRARRNADPRWKEELAWAKGSEPEAFLTKCRQKPNETPEDFLKRQTAGKRRSRRDTHRVEKVYPDIRCFYSTWNHCIKSCDQALSSVLKLRAQGLPADWRRPRWDDPNTIVADKPGQYRILERGNLWWTLEMRLKEGWVTFKAKFGNWHPIEGDLKLKHLKLTRRKNGNGWSYSASLSIEGLSKQVPKRAANQGVVALDWGHREHQHPNAHLGIRAFTWLGDDGAEGEVLIPTECRELKDQVNETKSKMDTVFNARKDSLGLPDRNRYAYRKRLRKAERGVPATKPTDGGEPTEAIPARKLTAEETLWLKWEMRYERRLMRMRKRIDNLRTETYTKAVRELREKYAFFVVENESTKQHQQLDIREMTPHRKRENRDLTARYSFLEISERYGAHKVEVPSRNSTRECTTLTCDGLLPKNGPELIVTCPKCGLARDKDRGACIVLLRRGQEALANPPVTS